jgi:uncharacterized Zn finger protein (UPF0148 family)
MENRLKSPIYKDGILFCPYCNSPLLTIEETHLRFKWKSENEENSTVKISVKICTT